MLKRIKKKRTKINSTHKAEKGAQRESKNGSESIGRDAVRTN